MKYTQQTINRYRWAMLDDTDWYEPLEEDLIRSLAEKGFYAEDVRWRGFSSQGDGASFQGGIADLNKFLQAYFPNGEYDLLKKAHDFNFKLERTSWHYAHEKTVSPDFVCEFCVQQAADDQGLDINDPFIKATLETMAKQIDALATEFERDALKELRAEMRKFYKILGDESDYLTSDEHIVEWLEANGIPPDAEQLTTT